VKERERDNELANLSPKLYIANGTSIVKIVKLFGMCFNFYSNARFIDVNGKTGQEGSNCSDVAMQSEEAVKSFKLSITLPNVNLYEHFFKLNLHILYTQVHSPYIWTTRINFCCVF
jgi:hypothetical protein